MTGGWRTPRAKILNVDGNIRDLEYKIKDKLGREVALMLRKLFSIRDHYGVKIVGDADLLLILATVVSINMEKGEEGENLKQKNCVS
ncbi:MAG: hypothetical protein QW279_09515 [Candidatus Jordarchaeaceae archaeon]